MNPNTVKNWVLKAESDLKVCRGEIRMERPATDAVCFHAQQCAEKYLKASLIFCDKEVPRIHNIAALVRECSLVDGSFRSLIEQGAPKLTAFAVEVRYGDEFFQPSIRDTEEAVAIALKVKEFVIGILAAKGFSV